MSCQSRSSSSVGRFAWLRVSLIKAHHQRAQSPLDHTVGDYLRDYWPTHDMNGAVVPVQRWNSWYNTISTRGLMSYINNAEPADKTAFRLTIFATMQWAYYSLWCGRISWQEMVSYGPSTLSNSC